MDGQELSISVQPGYILVEDPREYNVIWSEQPLKLHAISDVCSDTGCKKVLVRVQKANVKLTTIEVFRLGEEIAKMGLQVAITSSSDTSRANEEFLENVATNRGSPIKFFDNVEDAKRWLEV